MLWKAEEKECFPNGVWTTYGVEVAESYQTITHRLTEDHHPEKGEKGVFGGGCSKKSNEMMETVPVRVPKKKDTNRTNIWKLSDWLRAGGDSNYFALKIVDS